MWGREHGVPVAPVDGDPQPDGVRRYREAHREALGDPVFRDRVQVLETEIARVLAGRSFWDLVDTYEKAHSCETQELSRRVHELSERVLGDGPLSNNWSSRNRGMARRTIESMEAYGSRQALYYRGLLRFVQGRFDQAAADFEGAAKDPEETMGAIPLLELALLRRAQMLDLMRRRAEALDIYERLLAPGTGTVAEWAESFIKSPFVLS